MKQIIALASLALAELIFLSTSTAAEYAAAGLKKSAFIYCAAVSAAMSSVRVVALLSKYIMVSLPFRSIGGRLCAPPYIHNMSYARAWTKRIYINNTTDIQLSPQFNII